MYKVFTFILMFNHKKESVYVSHLYSFGKLF